MEQVLGPIYHYIYLIIATAISLPVFAKYNRLSPPIHTNNNNTALIIVLFITIFIGLRPISGIYFVDMGGYARIIDTYENTPFYFERDTDNILFDNLIVWWGCTGLGKTSFFLMMSTIYFVTAYIGLKKLFPKYELAAFLVFVGAFSTFAYGTNGIKAGAAASIFICALGFWPENQIISKIISVALILISYGFHHSMQLPIAAFIMALLIKKPKYIYVIWCIGIVLSAFHITYFQTLFGELTDEQGARYLLVDESKTSARIAFRPDFIIYSAIPVAIGYYYEIKKRLTNKTYSLIVHLYTLLNTIWLLCMYASYNNRIAYLSWFLYPIVILYPYLYVDTSINKYKYFSKAARYNLYFSLFMTFIFYNYIK